MLHLIYASAATAPMSDDELGALLAPSRDKNVHRRVMNDGITPDRDCIHCDLHRALEKSNADLF